MLEEQPDADFQPILYGQETSAKKWILPRLIFKDFGNDRFWQTGVDVTEGQLYMWYGVVNGKVQFKAREIIPKVNRTMQEQGLLEAQHRYDKKFKAGYMPLGSGLIARPNVMLSHKFHTEMKLNYPVDCDTKLNGIRMIVRFNGNKIEATSRTNHKQPFLEHITDECKQILKYLPAGTALDGELFNPKICFEEIASIVRTKNVRPVNIREIQYHVYDLILFSTPFEERRAMLENAIYQYRSNELYYDLERYPYGHPGLLKNERIESFIYLTMITTVKNLKELKRVHEDYVTQGHEGTMIKKRANGATSGKPYDQSLYVSNRRANTLKYKDVIDEEAEIIGIVDSTGNEKGCAVLTIKDIRGNVFDLRPNSTLEERRKWFKNPKLVVGKQITIGYQNLSKYGVPIHPRGIAIRDYE